MSFFSVSTKSLSNNDHATHEATPSPPLLQLPQEYSSSKKTLRSNCIVSNYANSAYDYIKAKVHSEKNIQVFFSTETMLKSKKKSLYFYTIRFSKFNDTLITS